MRPDYCMDKMIKNTNLKWAVRLRGECLVTLSDKPLAHFLYGTVQKEQEKWYSFKTAYIGCAYRIWSRCYWKICITVTSIQVCKCDNLNGLINLNGCINQDWIEEPFPHKTLTYLLNTSHQVWIQPSDHWMYARLWM